jgi:hypothetical protein
MDFSEEFGLSDDAPEAFGRSLDIMISRNLPAGLSPSKGAGWLADELGIEPGMINAWVRGEFLSGKRRMTAEHFRRLVMLFYGKPLSPKTPQEAAAWAACADREYASDLTSGWFEVWLAGHSVTRPETPTVTMPRQRSGLIERSDLQKIMQKRAVQARVNRQPLVVWGPPGSGKTSLVEVYARGLEEPLDHEHILWMPMGTGVSSLAQWLNAWQLRLVPFEIFDRSDVPRSLEIIRSALRSKAWLIVIDDCHSPDLACPIIDLASDRSLVIVTTTDGQVARALTANDSTLLMVPPFTLEEVERLYHLAWRNSLSKPDDEQLRQLWTLTRGNPLGPKLALHQVQARGWAETLLALSEPPLPTPAGVAAELFQPLHLAHELLTQKGLAAYWIRLGALPQLETYDLETFAMLWEMAPGRASDTLTTLEQDAGLVSRRSSGGWEIHRQVRNYGDSLLKQAPPTEQAAASSWANRLTTTGGQKQVYRRFRANQPRLDLRGVLQRRRALNLPDSPPLHKRTSEIMRHPEHVIAWEVVKDNSQNFTSAEYALAFQLCQEEQQSHRLIAAGLVLSLGLFLVACAMTLVGSFMMEAAPLALPTALIVLALDAMLVTSIGVRIVFIDLAREPAWLAIWQQANARRTKVATES